MTALLLSRIYAFSIEKEKAQQINYSAFINLAKNISEISKPATILSSSAVEDTHITTDIIHVIDGEISRKIASSKIRSHIINRVKPTRVAVNKIKTTSEDLTAFEINNSELISLYGISTEKVATTKLEELNWVAINSDTVIDEVSAEQASTEIAPVIADEVSTTQPAPEKNDEEMVMFDYSDKAAPVVAEAPKTIDQKLYERPISNVVKNAISREIGSTPAAKTLKQAEPKEVDDKKIDLNSEDNIIYDYSNTDTVKKIESATSAFAALAPEKEQGVETQFILKAKEINLSTQKQRQARSFEFVPDYDRSERSDDQGSGEIGFGYSLTGAMNTQTGIVHAVGMIPTRVELNLEGRASFEVPLINEQGIQKFLEKEGLSVEGNLLMLSIDSSIKDTEIDSNYAGRFYFDKKFKVLTNGPVGASFVLFAGVKTGNILVRYLLNNKETAQKIVYVGDGEMYFEDAEFIASEREVFELTTRNLLGQKRKELIIDGSLINFFNTSISAKKKALSAYEMKIPTMPSGMRKYLEFKHLKDTIFVGSSNVKEIEIPTNDFIEKVLEVNQVSSLKDRCVVQVNLSKDVREIKANGKNRSGEMYIETNYLDKDGNFSNENFESASSMFMVGDQEGLFSVRLDYTDGSVGFLKTFCSEGSYVVEQL